MKKIWQVIYEAIKWVFDGCGNALIPNQNSKKIVVKNSKKVNVKKNRECDIKVSKSEDVDLEGNINSR